MKNLLSLFASLFHVSRIRFWIYKTETVLQFIRTLDELRQRNSCLFDRLCLQAELGDQFHHTDVSSIPMLQEAEDLLVAHGLLFKTRDGKTAIPWFKKNLILGLTVDFGDCALMNTQLPVVQKAYRSMGLLA